MAIWYKIRFKLSSLASKLSISSSRELSVFSYPENRAPKPRTGVYGTRSSGCWYTSQQNWDFQKVRNCYYMSLLLTRVRNLSETWKGNIGVLLYSLLALFTLSQLQKHESLFHCLKHQLKHVLTTTDYGKQWGVRGPSHASFYREVRHVLFGSWQGPVQHFSSEAHGLRRSQSSVRELKSYHSLGKNLSRGFSMTEHVESELLLLLLPGRQRNEPKENQRKKKQEKEHIHREKFSSRENFKGQSSFVLQNQNLLSLKTRLGGPARVPQWQSHAGNYPRVPAGAHRGRAPPSTSNTGTQRAGRTRLETRQGIRWHWRPFKLRRPTSYRNWVLRPEVMHSYNYGKDEMPLLTGRLVCLQSQLFRSNITLSDMTVYVLRFHGKILKSSLNILKFLSLKERHFTIKYFNIWNSSMFCYLKFYF